MSDWKPIESAPHMKTVLLFAHTDDMGNGKRNWRMETGHWSTGHEGWIWGGDILQVWDFKPTHWKPLPEPPSPEIE